MFNLIILNEKTGRCQVRWVDGTVLCVCNSFLKGNLIADALRNASENEIWRNTFSNKIMLKILKAEKKKN